MNIYRPLTDNLIISKLQRKHEKANIPMFVQWSPDGVEMIHIGACLKQAPTLLISLY